MKFKILLFVLLFVISNNLLSQKNPKVINAFEKLKKGNELYEADKYEDALKEFQTIPENDTAYFNSVVEQVLNYYQLKQYEKGIEVGKKALSLQLYLSYEIYLNIGICYDNLEKYDEAVKMYNDGIKVFPKANLLYFNMGFSLTKLGKNKEAFECFKKSAELNPFHSRTHYALGAIAMNEGNTALAMLAFSTYILLDPQSANANNALVFINNMSTSKYQENFKPFGIDISGGDDFSEIDMLIQNYVALDKKYKTKSKLDYPFIKQTYLLFDKLPENTANKGFWYNTYLPFYKQILKDDKFDLFAMYLIVPSANDSHKEIVEKNKSKLIDFEKWVKDAWDDQNRKYEMEFNGKKQEVDVFRANKRYAISSIGVLNATKDAYIGYAEFYHENGRLKGHGNNNAEGKRDGEWSWYYDNGNIESRAKYANGELLYNDSYSFLGVIESHIPYKNGKIEGEAVVYTPEGAKGRLIACSGNQRNGNYEEYFSNGQISLKGTYNNGLLDGNVKTFYNSSELLSEVNYLEGQKNGLEIYYFRNGKVSQKSNFTKGKLQGEYISYFDNGKISDSLKYVNDNPVGKNIQYHKNGVISVSADFDESGKLNGVRKEFDTDGKIYNELEYKKGEITGYKYYNKKGEVINQDKKKSGDFDFKVFYPNGTLKSSGLYSKEDKQGEWKYYDMNGNFESISGYKDGKTQGESKIFFPNGKVQKIFQNKDDLAEGYYLENEKDGNISMEGNYKGDKLEGDWISYNPDKTISSETYYVEGMINGTQKIYTIDGRLSEKKHFYKGIPIYLLNYDTLGNVIDSIGFVNATNKIVYHYFKGGSVKLELNMVYGDYQNDYIRYFPNGKLQTKGKYFNGQENGDWTWYYWNGTINVKGFYIYGQETGKWEYYNEDGQIYRTIEYKEGKRNGKDINYYENGKTENELEYVDGQVEGTAFYYSYDGSLEYKRQYMHNQFNSYTYFLPNGAEKTVDLNNETAEVKIYFKNGKIAKQYNINKGLFQGDYNKYYATGQLSEKSTYVDDNLKGEKLNYYPNGKLKVKRNFYFDEPNGIFEEYYPDGKLKETSNYLYGKRQGKRLLYDKNGKLSVILTYYNDELIAIDEK